VALIDPLDLAWLAGLLEGEGCFSQNKASNRTGTSDSIRVHVGMNDMDVVERAARLLGTRLLGPYSPSQAHRDGCVRKPQYRAVVTGAKAAAWMELLLPLMGERRKAAISGCLEFWKGLPPSSKRVLTVADPPVVRMSLSN
jgi:hypothetical protein